MPVMISASGAPPPAMKPSSGLSAPFARDFSQANSGFSRGPKMQHLTNHGGNARETSWLAAPANMAEVIGSLRRWILHSGGGRLHISGAFSAGIAVQNLAAPRGRARFRKFLPRAGSAGGSQ